MTLVLHICTGLGLALAAGIRPFTPAWLAGALAGSNVLFDFRGTSYAFLQSGVFLVVVGVIFVASAILRRRELNDLVAGATLALGGLLFGAILASHHDAAWPGLIAGVAAAGLAQYASRPVLAGASERVGDDGAARFAVTLYGDAAALVLAAACWFAGPLSLVALAFFARLAWVQRARGSTRFRGLRVLR